MANGRIEVERVDVATKYAGRVDRIEIRLVAQLDTAVMTAQLAALEAAVRSARQSIARAEAEVALRAAEHRLSELELARVQDLEAKNIATTADLDRRDAQHAIAEANLQGARASLETANAAVDQARAQSAQLRVMIAEMALKAPIAGRVEYKLVQPGSVIGAGDRVATILDLSDVYMSVFLPTSQAGVLAQDKFMYRVKLRFAPDLLVRFQGYVKAGYTGDAYLRLAPDLDWPVWLETRLPDGP